MIYVDAVLANALIFNTSLLSLNVNGNVLGRIGAQVSFSQLSLYT